MVTSPASRWTIAAIVVLAALFLFVDARTMPIILWDESRTIVNALEMKRTGLGLVTTYRGAPDLWNTKPPLLIWLMVASISAFGTAEWALRLPSLIATLGTVLMLVLVVRRTTGSVATAALAAFLMVASPAFFGEHSGRTADYDALLLFFTTAYLFLFFGAVHRARPSAATALLIGALIAGAVLTKSVAGLMPGLGVTVYLVLTKRLGRILHEPRWALTILVAIVPVVLFFVAREQAAPGYLAAAWHNDVGGRFASTLITVPRPPGYYLRQLWAGYFSATPLLLLAPSALFVVRGRQRILLCYSLVVAVLFVGVISAAASKLNHYLLPALPFMAIAAAITVRALIGRLVAVARSHAPGARLAAVALFLLVALPLMGAARGAIDRRYCAPDASEGARSGGYRAVLTGLAARHARQVTILDGGFVNDGMPHYTPVLRAYDLIWSDRGMAITQIVEPRDLDGRRGMLVASCDAASVPLLRARIADVAGVPDCIAGTLQ